jgi:ABC-2 type transport system permease protein
MADLEYRLNVITKIFTDVLWYGAQASVFEVLFHHVPQISGWTLPVARVFMAILFLVDAIWMVMFQENFERLSWKVKRGELDLMLVKPINSQFMVTMQKQNTSYIFNVLLTLVYFFLMLSHLPDPTSTTRVAVMFVVAIPTALAINYSFRLMFATLSVIYTNAESVNHVWYQIYRLGMRPDPFYPPWLRLVVLSVLPVGFIASVPARILTGDATWALILAGPLLAFLLLWLSHQIWEKALTRYASASS